MAQLGSHLLLGWQLPSSAPPSHPGIAVNRGCCPALDCVVVERCRGAQCVHIVCVGFPLGLSGAGAHPCALLSHIPLSESRPPLVLVAGVQVWSLAMGHSAFVNILALLLGGTYLYTSFGHAFPNRGDGSLSTDSAKSLSKVTVSIHNPTEKV